MHRLPFSLSKKSDRQGQGNAAAGQSATANKVLEGFRQRSRPAASTKTSHPKPQSDLHQHIENSIAKKRNLELLLRQLEWKRASLNEEAAFAVTEKEEAAKGLTNAESQLHAKMFEKDQLEHQVQNGKDIIEELNQSIQTLLEGINTAKAEHQQAMESFIEQCAELNHRQRTLRVQSEDSLMDWTHISHADAQEADEQVQS